MEYANLQSMPKGRSRDFDATIAAIEVEAWVAFAAGALPKVTCCDAACEIADRMMVEFRKRFIRES